MFSPGQPGSDDCRWWVNESDDEAVDRKIRGERLANVASTIYRVQEPQRQLMTVCWRLYANQPIIGLSPRTYKLRVPGTRFNAQGLNIVKACTDSYTALITKDEPRTFFDVVGGDRKLKRKAKHLQCFTDGLSYETGLQELRPQVVRDSGLFGSGIVKIYRMDDQPPSPRIAIERINPWEILCDEQEASYGNPANLYQMKYVDRRALMEEYPEYASEIRLASSQSFMDSHGNTYTDTNFMDFAVVIEGWHLPRVVGPDGSHDGRHTIIVGQLVLDDEEYNWDRFPFEFCYRNRPVQGIYGQPIPQELAPVQLEINRLMRTIRDSQRLAVGHWFVEANSDVDTNAINDVIASIVRWSGVKPEYIQFPPVTADVYNYLWTLWMKGFEELGISQMASMSQKPQGLNSAVAINTYADVQSDRFRPAYREYQHWNLRVTEQILHLAREISEDCPAFEVKATGSRSMMKTIKASDALLKDEEFNLKLKEVNELGESVAQKIQTVTDFTSAGLIDPISSKRMLLEDGGMPDLTSYESLEASSYNFVEFCADKAIDEGKYIQPNLFMDSIPNAIHAMRQFYLKAQIDGVPDDKLRLMRQWMDAAANLIPPPPPPVPAPGLPATAPGGGSPKPGGPLALASTMAAAPKPPL